MQLQKARLPESTDCARADQPAENKAGASSCAGFLLKRGVHHELTKLTSDKALRIKPVRFVLAESAVGCAWRVGEDSFDS